MKIVCISDTHGKHEQISLPQGDVLVHAGDFTPRGKRSQVLRFLDWFAALPHPHKVLIGGNHDFFLEEFQAEFREMLPDGIVYLEDEMAEVAGIKFWGSPITPFFFNWAFNRFRGEQIRAHWEKIPETVDILLTHGPAYGFGDETIRASKVGCKDLLEKVLAIKPRYHIFGHIHEAYGISQNEHTTFVNASCLNVRYEAVNEPIVLNF